MPEGLEQSLKRSNFRAIKLGKPSRRAGGNKRSAQTSSNDTEFMNEVEEVLSVCQGATALEEEPLHMRSSLYEINRRLLQSEWLSLVSVDALLRERGSTASGFAACETFLCPFDVSFYFEARAKLEIRGTAVETVLSAPVRFVKEVTATLAEISPLPLVSADNKYKTLSAHNATAATRGMLDEAATELMKTPDYSRFLCSELRWAGPANAATERTRELDHVGQVGPTQFEAKAIVCEKTMGSRVAVSNMKTTVEILSGKMLARRVLTLSEKLEGECEPSSTVRKGLPSKEKELKLKLGNIGKVDLREI